MTALVLAALLAAPVARQTGAETRRAEAAAAPVVAPASYVVGPGDILEITVEGHPDLSRAPAVQTSGTVWLPRAGEVEVAGLTLAQVAARLSDLVVGPDLGTPHVSVRLKDAPARFVWLRGALARPARRPLAAGARLIDVLLEAGGFAPTASGEVSIERTNGTFEDGSRVRRLRFSGANPTAAELLQLALPLASGDVVTALEQRWVFVEGAVRNPGRYRCEAGLTVSRAVAAAGGLLAAADTRVLLVRHGSTREIRADLDAIREGRAEDLPLLPEDRVSARSRRP